MKAHSHINFLNIRAGKGSVILISSKLSNYLAHIEKNACWSQARYEGGLISSSNLGRTKEANYMWGLACKLVNDSMIEMYQNFKTIHYKKMYCRCSTVPNWKWKHFNGFINNVLHVTGGRFMYNRLEIGFWCFN